MKYRVIALVLALTLCLSGCQAIRTKKSYKEALELAQAGEYLHAASVFESIAEYEDSADRAVSCRYQYAADLYRDADWAAARVAFKAVEDYQNSAQLIDECTYQIAKNWFESGDFESAQVEFSAIPEYADASRYLELCEARLHAWEVFLSWVEANSEADGSNLALTTHTPPEGETSYLLLNPEAGDLFFNLYLEGSDGITRRTALCIYGPDAGLVIQTDYRYEGTTPVFAEGTANTDVAVLKAETELLLASYSDYYVVYDTELYTEDQLLASLRNGVHRILEVFPEVFEGFGTDVLYRDLGILAPEG